MTTGPYNQPIPASLYPPSSPSGSVGSTTSMCLTPTATHHCYTPPRVRLGCIMEARTMSLILSHQVQERPCVQRFRDTQPVILLGFTPYWRSRTRMRGYFPLI
ncbi:hypothetical protein ABVK25_001064 [Lepraria finkii]|uniref:Uncharacterized protein n=1 Tax=Lepraria finkii TaxID=1340010 RepID=A0ABR4BKX1_9LECA